jgi:hypothetical protein
MEEVDLGAGSGCSGASLLWFLGNAVALANSSRIRVPRDKPGDDVEFHPRRVDAAGGGLGRVVNWSSGANDVVKGPSDPYQQEIPTHSTQNGFFAERRRPTPSGASSRLQIDDTP